MAMSKFKSKCFSHNRKKISAAIFMQYACKYNFNAKRAWNQRQIHCEQRGAFRPGPLLAINTVIIIIKIIIIIIFEVIFDKFSPPSRQMALEWLHLLEEEAREAKTSEWKIELHSNPKIFWHAALRLVEEVSMFIISSQDSAPLLPWQWNTTFLCKRDFFNPQRQGQFRSIVVFRHSIRMFEQKTSPQ